MKFDLSGIQRLGAALMLPIAVLPAASLLLRLGQPDLLDITFLAAAGDALFTSLGLLFAIGVAVGLSKDGNGAAGLAGAVCFLVATKGAEELLVIPAELLAEFDGAALALAVNEAKQSALGRLSVPIGIVSGILAGFFYNRYSTLRFPDYLAFFGGRRFIPIVSGLAGVGVALLVGLSFNALNSGVDKLSQAVVESGDIGLFVYGALNRLLIVTGLHHVLNNVAWFVVGDYGGVTGDLRRFFAGDPDAGAFMAGFFPVMMFGLPAACLAMYHSAPPENRRMVGGMLLSVGLTAALTGVTEPIEFTFMFLAPALYGMHVVLTGLSMVVMSLLGVKLGFGFSAGLFDYLLNFGLATRPLLLLPIGLVIGCLYYVSFRYAIVRFGLITPGREGELASSSEDSGATTVSSKTGHDRARAFIAALGGDANVTLVDACTTRLRLTLVDADRVNEKSLKNLGAYGVLRLTHSNVQVVVGPTADELADLIRSALAPMSKAADETSGEPETADDSLRTGKTQLTPDEAAELAQETDALVKALGGLANIAMVQPRGSRLVVTLLEAVELHAALSHCSIVRTWSRTPGNALHILVGPMAQVMARIMVEQRDRALAQSPFSSATKS